MGNRTRRRYLRGRDERGQALVEFAVVFPILLLFVLGIIQLALAYNARLILQYAAFAAARSYIVYQDRGKAEFAARLVCVPISARPTAIASGLLGVDIPDYDALEILGDVAGVAERYIYSAYATRVKMYDAGGSPLPEDRILEPRKDDVTVEVSHDFYLAIPIINRLVGKPMIGGVLGSLFDFGLYYLPITARTTLTVEDAPSPPDTGPCYGNISLGCCFTQDEVEFIGCRGTPSCTSVECCPEKSRRTWRIRSDVAKRKGLGEKGTIVREMPCTPTT